MLIEDDSCSRSVMFSRTGRAASTTDEEERNEKHSRSTWVLSRYTCRERSTYPSKPSVSRMRRIAARESPVVCAISTILRPWRCPSKLSITRRPRASESTKSGFPACAVNTPAGVASGSRGSDSETLLVALIILSARLSHILYNCGQSGNNACLNGGRMAEWVSLAEAIAANVHDDDSVAIEGFTHLIPFAAAHEIIRQRRRNLSLIRMTPDLTYAQPI